MANVEIEDSEEETTNESRMDLKSLDLKTKFAAQLRELEPSIFTENKIDFEALKAMLDGDFEEGTERYGLTWPGKRECMRIIQEQSTGTLIPDREESVDFDNTENLFIEGDNLEVLKLLQKSYARKIKMIYIDPPYNTNSDFVYNDKFGEGLKNYFQKTDQIDNKGNKLVSNLETGGRYHSNWLNMLYPRLFLARNLLSADGSIFISIDDHEESNLRSICNQVFGEENFVACIVWKRKRGRDNSAKYFSKSHEYVLVYSKQIAMFKTNFLELDSETKTAYKNPDNDPRGIYRMLAVWARGTQSGVTYEFTSKTGQVFKERTWLFSKENLTKLDNEDKLIFKGENIYRKLFIDENKGKIPETLWTHTSNAANASDEIKTYFGNILFDTAKPVPYVVEMLKIASEPGCTVLDFFAGSATTSDALMTLNAEDGGNRKCISVQLPEQTPGDSEARKAGYETIADIAKERIRRAGKKIREENEGKLDFDSSKLDTGFKVFKLQESNFTLWDGKANADATQEEVTEQLSLAQNNVREGATQEAIVYEILLKKGYPLETPLKIKKLENGTIYTLAKEDQEDSLIICMEPTVSQELIDEIVDLKPIMTVFKDMAFTGNDQLKVNAKKQFEGLNPDTTEKAFETV